MALETGFTGYGLSVGGSNFQTVRQGSFAGIVYHDYKPRGCEYSNSKVLANPIP